MMAKAKRSGGRERRSGRRPPRSGAASVVPALTGRHMFIWRLPPILTVERGADEMADKARAARLSGVWIKMAVGGQPYSMNLTPDFARVRDALAARGIVVWGWHEPRCADVEAATAEARVVSELAVEWGVKGVLMDAETPQGGLYFQGGHDEALAYGQHLRERLEAAGLALAICSHDIPQNFPAFPFDDLAQHAHVNAPQVYYGGSPSVSNRLERAIRANSHLTIPFVPVGAGWVGPGGGCESASACAERALAFIRLVKLHGFPAYSFWHWAGAPLELWELLIEVEA
jgi:hypothetical protein